MDLEKEVEFPGEEVAKRLAEITKKRLRFIPNKEVINILNKTFKEKYEELSLKVLFNIHYIHGKYKKMADEIMAKDYFIASSGYFLQEAFVR